MTRFEGIKGWLNTWGELPSLARPYFIAFDDCYRMTEALSGRGLVDLLAAELNPSAPVADELIVGLMLPVWPHTESMRRAPRFDRALARAYDGAFHPRIRVSGPRPTRMSSRYPFLQEPVDSQGLPGDPLVSYETYKSEFELDTGGDYVRWFCVDWMLKPEGRN